MLIGNSSARDARKKTNKSEAAQSGLWNHSSCSYNFGHAPNKSDMAIASENSCSTTWGSANKNNPVLGNEDDSIMKAREDTTFRDFKGEFITDCHWERKYLL